MTAFRPMFAASVTSSWFPEFPAATTFAVAKVTGFVLLIRSSGVACFTGNVGALRIWEWKKQATNYTNDVLMVFSFASPWFVELRQEQVTEGELTIIGCLMASIEESKALAPRDALSSTLLTVINNEETLATMSWNEDKSPCKNACNHSQQHFSYKVFVFIQ